MKTKLYIIGVVLLSLSLLYGCGKSTDEKAKTETVKVGERDGKDKSKLDYEIVSEEVLKLAKESGTEAHYIAEIKNTSESPLYFNSTGNSLDLESANGEILTVTNSFYVRPSVVNPGETGYVSEEILFSDGEGKGLSGDDIGNAIMHLEVNKADEVPIPKVEISETALQSEGLISITGRIKNNEPDLLQIAHIIIPVRDSSDRLCAVATGQVENMQSDEQKGFEAMDFIYYDGDSSQLKMEDAIVCGDRKMFGGTVYR